MKKILVITAVLLLSGLIFAGTSFSFRHGTAAFDFLRLPIGAVNFATGQAMIASMDNSLAAVVNPARLSEIGNWDIRGGSTQWILDTNYQFAGIAKRLSDRLGVVSLVVRNFSYGDFDYTIPWGYTEDPAESGETFTGGAICTTLGWGKQLTKNFAFGVGMNYAVETLEEYSMDGVFFNIGFIYENEEYLKGLRLGFTAENFGTTIAYFEDSEPATLPLVMKYALRWDVYQTPDAKHKFVLEGNAAQYKDKDMYGAGALTYIFNSFFHLFIAGSSDTKLFKPISLGSQLKFRIGGTMIDVAIAYNMTKHFGDKITFEAGAMIF